MADPELASLVARARKGDRAAFEKIVQGTTRLVYAQIVASVRDRQRAEDLTQETFVSAWKGIGSQGYLEKVSGEGTAGGGSGRSAAAGFVSWLLTIARNVTLDAIKFESRQKRDTARELTGPSAEDVVAAARTPPESAEAREARDHALRVLAEMPDEYRQVLAMRYLAGADYETIHRQLGLTHGALRGLLNRGMALMRERMGSTRQGDKVKG